MRSTTAYKKWELVLISFPFTNLKSEKKRPSLIVSPDEYNRGPDVVILFVTSKLNRPYRTGDYRIRDPKKAGLPKPSMIRMKFATIDKTIIKRKLGRLSEKDIKDFQKELFSLLSE